MIINPKLVLQATIDQLLHDFASRGDDDIAKAGKRKAATEAPEGSTRARSAHDTRTDKRTGDTSEEHQTPKKRTRIDWDSLRRKVVSRNYPAWALVSVPSR